VLLFGDWSRSREPLLGGLEALGFPTFVKPANLGSSVGISKAKTREELATAVDYAFEYDRKVVVEAAVPAARELEVGVLGNDAPEASVAGEVIPGREFYDYEAKYLDTGSTTKVPADLDPKQHTEVRRLAVEAFKAVDCSGMARVDFLLSKDTGRLFVNEINTIPGFTTISMYSQLWAASGVDYPALLDRLIKLAIERHAEKQRLKTSAS
jgi:D-alanine-D-alanine ligase